MSELSTMPHLATRPERDLAMLSGALRDAQLPADDLAEPGRLFFRFVDGEGATVGFGGIEPSGDAALLRSVVVVPAMRGRGLGAAVVHALESEARRRGIRDLYLLTISAVAFFESQGYRPTRRVLAPPAIRSSRQFLSLCPSSAALLTKQIDA